MLRLAANQLISPRAPFEEDILSLRDFPVSAVGIWRDKLLEYGVEKACELLQETGLEVSSLQWAGGFTGDEMRRYDECIADAHEAIWLAEKLQAPCLVVYSGGRAGHTKKHAKKLFHEALQQLIPHAQDAGVKLALEPMHPATSRDWSIADSLTATMEWVDRLDCDTVQLIFDSYHVCQDERWPEWLEQYRDRIALIHLADTNSPHSLEQNRCLLGEGRLPLAEFVGRLEDIDYQGFVEIELFGESIEGLSLQEVLRHSVEALTDLKKVAQ